jgi:diguanylate cyclase (GGDEF)-like protein
MVIELGGYHVPVAWLLAVVTALAYVLGRCGRRPALFSDQQVLELERELRRAQAAAVKLEQIVRTTRTSLDKHQYRLKRFKKRVARLAGQPQDEIWQKLSREIEDVLSPTVHLAAQIASVHDVIRYESSLLMTLTDSRRDALTGICNRRGLDRALGAQLAVMDRYGSPCSLLLLDIDSFKDVNDRQGHLCGDQILCDLARLLEEEAREVDVLARYGGDEFTIVMTQTGLDGALVLAERVRRKVEQTMSVTVSGGVAAAKKSDTPAELFRRADIALYRAKVSGRNCMFFHNGANAEPVPRDLASPDASAIALNDGLTDAPLDAPVDAPASDAPLCQP